MAKLLFMISFIAFSAHAQLKIYWLGVAGIYFTDGKSGIMFDPVFHRPPLLDVLFGKDVKIDEAFTAKVLDFVGAKKVDAIFSTHSHHDHFYDAPVISKLRGSNIYGSLTSVNISKSYGIDEKKLFDMNNGDKFKFGDFEVEAISVKHGKVMGFYEFQFGELTEVPKHPLNLSMYRVGKPFSYILTYKDKKYLIQQASGYTDNIQKRIRGENFEIIFQGLGNRKDTPDLMNNLWKLTTVKAIMPMHHDNFFAPFSHKVFDSTEDAKKIDHLFNINYQEFLDVTKANNYKVIEPIYFRPLPID